MKAEVNLNEVLKTFQVSCKVTGKKRAKIKIWVFSQLLKLACFIMGSKVEITFDEPEENPGKYFINKNSL